MLNKPLLIISLKACNNTNITNIVQSCCDVLLVSELPPVCFSVSLFHHGSISRGALAGYSSGSAGGSVIHCPGPPEAASSSPKVEVTDGAVSPITPAPPAAPVEGHDATAPQPASKDLAAVEADMMDKLKARMAEMESNMIVDFENRKRAAEQELENINAKKQCMEMEIELLKVQQADEESKLGIVSEQLQDKMLCVSEEQTILDDLREKSKAVEKQLEEAAKTMNAKQSAENNLQEQKEQQKEALRLKLQQASANKAAVPSTPVTSSPAPSQAPSTVTTSTPPPAPVVPSDAMVPVSSQRFTSSTHPEAWQYLYRLAKNPDKCDEEVYKAWHEGLDV